MIQKGFHDIKIFVILCRYLKTNIITVSHQGFYQLLEPKVTIRCRKQDIPLVQVSKTEGVSLPFLPCSAVSPALLWAVWGKPSFKVIMFNDTCSVTEGKFCADPVVCIRWNLIPNFLVPFRHPSRRTFPYIKQPWRTTLRSALTRITSSPLTCKQNHIWTTNQWSLRGSSLENLATS